MAPPHSTPGLPGRISRFRFACLPALLVAVVLLAGCHEEGGIEVKSFDLTGVHAFSADDLKKVLATRESGRFPWSPRRYFDRARFDADLQRIHAFYLDHGRPAQTFTGVHVEISGDRSSVRLKIDVDEGAPVIVEKIGFEGFEALPDSARGRLTSGPLVEGQPRDRDRVRASRDVATRLLKNNGHPLAYVDASERPGASPDRVIVTFRADPGPALRFGDITVDGLEGVNATVVQQQLTFAPNDEYRESRLLGTQRRLSSIELFELVNVTPRLEQLDGDRVPVRVTIAEGKPRRLKFGVGYGTEERARGTINWQHLNLFGAAQRFEVDANASFLDQGVTVSFIEPRLGRHGWTLNFAGDARKTRQLTYDAQNYGGRVTANYRLLTGAAGVRDPVRYQARVSYSHEYVSFGIREDSLNDLSLREERIALGLNPDTGRGAGTLASIAVDLERAAVDNVLDPRRGVIATIHLEHAAPWLLGSYRFDELLVEGRGYIPLGSAVLAARARFGTVAAADPSRVPFSKRYFLGGATSLRGWGRFQVSPLDDHGLPIGGRTLAELSSEVRFPIAGRIAGVFFVDAGAVGSSDFSVGRLPMRVDIGPGLRYQTPIGAVRADVGYQLTAIDGLVINGKPETRRWRLHLSIGQAF